VKIGQLDLKNPITLSPLCGVTDLPFRALARAHGASLTHTQMISSAALCRQGREKSLRYMELGEDETPVGVQLFGCDPSEMAEAARIAADEGADLISINFGCPVPKVVKHNGGSAMLKEPMTLQAVVEAVVEAVDLPVVPKIRTGWDAQQINAPEIALRCQDAGAAAIAIHGRTRAQGYGGRADWSLISAVKQRLKIPVIGNGDLFEPEDIPRAMRESGVDAVMLGRGAMGNPWLFSRAERLLATGQAGPEPTPQERVDVLLGHLRASYAYKGPRGLAEMRRQSMGYFKGLPHAAELRLAMNQTLDMAAIEDLLLNYRSRLTQPEEALA